MISYGAEEPVNINIRLPGIFPIIQDGSTLLAQQKNTLVQINLETWDRKYAGLLPGSLKTRIMRRFSLLSRLGRKNVLWGTQTARSTLIATRDGVYKVDEAGMQIERPFEPNKYFLSPVYVSNIPGFPDGVYAGDYLSNPKKKPVSIWYRSEDGCWTEKFSFGEGAVNHIHAVVPDPYRGCLWILTGDFDAAPNIWKATYDFTDVSPLFQPAQRFRACWLLPCPDCIIWGTDTQLERNGIYKYFFEGGSLQKIADIPGSSIYSMRTSKGIFFSTTLEPERASRLNLLAWLSARPAKYLDIDGAGIYLLDNQGCVTEIFRAQPAKIPFRLFQYPTFQFPLLINEGSSRCVFARTIRGIDGNLIVW